MTTLRAELTENAHRDLIASGVWSYRRWVGGVDDGAERGVAWTGSSTPGRSTR